MLCKMIILSGILAIVSAKPSNILTPISSAPSGVVVADDDTQIVETYHASLPTLVRHLPTYSTGQLVRGATVTSAAVPVVSLPQPTSSSNSFYHQQIRNTPALVRTTYSTAPVVYRAPKPSLVYTYSSPTFIY